MNRWEDFEPAPAICEHGWHLGPDAPGDQCPARGGRRTVVRIGLDRSYLYALVFLAVMVTIGTVWAVLHG